MKLINYKDEIWVKPLCGLVKNPSIGLIGFIEKTQRFFFDKIFGSFLSNEKGTARLALRRKIQK